MTGFLILGAVYGLHAAVLLAGFTGPRARFAGGMALVAVNYGLRRLLFLDPVLGADPAAWFGLILLGDFVFALLIGMSAMRPAQPLRLQAVDIAVGILFLATVVLALTDGRVPLTVRAAHWKDEYFYLGAYVLARLNGPRGVEGIGILGSLAVAAVGLALWQSLAGPLWVDLAWIASGRSVLTTGGTAALAGAHGVGNLEAGWIRPYGFFGNGTDFGVFLVAVAVLAAAAPLPVNRPVSPAAFLGRMMRPVPLLCAAGVVLSVVRFTWAVLALAVLFTLVLGTAGTLRRSVRLALFGGGLAVVGTGFILLAPEVAGSGSLFERAFVTGTYLERLEAQAAYLGLLAERPTILLVGEGFGAHGSAAAKFAFEPAGPSIDHHSRVLDLVQDGGLGLLVLTLLPLVLALWMPGGADPRRAATLGFCLAFFMAAALLGAKSALLQTLYWGLLGAAVNRSLAAWTERAARAPLPTEAAS